MTIRHGRSARGDGARPKVQVLVGPEVDFAGQAPAPLHWEGDAMGRSLGVLSPPLAQMGEPECAELVVPPCLTGRSRSHRPASGRFQHVALARDGVPVPLHTPMRWDRLGIRLDFGGQLPPYPLTSGIFIPLVGFAGDGQPIAALTTVPERAPWHARALAGLPDSGVIAQSVASFFVWIVVARRPTVVIVLLPVFVRRRGA
jgi:hypothetical protein